MTTHSFLKDVILNESFWVLGNILKIKILPEAKKDSSGMALKEGI